MKKIFNNFWVEYAVIPVILIIPIVWFCLPLLTLNTENIRVIAHFDLDESAIINFLGQMYPKGLLPIYDQGFTYPQLFYYIAGIVLFPFTSLKGVDLHAIVIVIRSFNVIIGAGTVIFINFFCIRFFKSMIAGILAGLLLSTMPDYLWWLINSRCHPLEILFIFIVLYFCFLFIENFRRKYLLWAVAFASFAASTKYGGIFTIPSIWLAYVYKTAHDTFDTLKIYLKSRMSKIYTSAAFIGASAFCLSAALYLLVARYSGVFSIFGAKNIKYVKLQNFKIFFVAAGIAIIVCISWVLINYATARIIENNSSAFSDRFVLILNKSLYILLIILCCIVTVFLILNPTYWLFPFTNIKIIMSQFANTYLGTSLKPKSGLFDIHNFLWFKNLADNRLLNFWFLGLFGLYILYEIIQFSKNWALQNKQLVQRMLIVVYIVSLFSVLFFVVSHRAHHYLLPIAVSIILLTVYGIITVPTIFKHSISRIITIGAIAAVFVAGFFLRLECVVDNYQTKANQNSKYDLAIRSGNWLAQHFSGNASVLTDSYFFYITPKFTNITSVHDDHSYFQNLDSKNFDILIITDPARYEQFLKYNLPKQKHIYEKIFYANNYNEFSDNKFFVVYIKKGAKKINYE